MVARTVTGLPGWPFGPIRVEGAVRIGAGHGLSGIAYRVTARTDNRDPIMFVIKEDDAAGIERALAFHTAIGEQLPGWIP